MKIILKWILNTCKLFVFKLSMVDSNVLKPPLEVADMMVLNKDLFRKQINVSRLVLKKDVKLSDVLPIVKKYLLKIEHFKPIDQAADRIGTIIYLNPEIVVNWTDLEDNDQKLLEERHVDKSNLKNDILTLNYDNFGSEAIFKAVLPKHLEGISSFTKVGHIVHVNLRDHLLPYKKLIGQVLWDKVPNCQCVVNKIDAIDNTYRNFKMEVLEGPHDYNTVVQVKQNRCTFELDFAKVYWNSRLSTEHERIVKMVGAGNVLFDVFAGVGPFSIPLAKRKCIVYANDLNPESFKWLNHNAKINKISSEYLKSFNKDGKDFIFEEVKKNLLQYADRNVYITMNLPALAVNFLSSFVNLYNPEQLEEVKFKPPLVIVYCFAKGEDSILIAKNVLFNGIGYNISDKIVDIFKVRTVSSLKAMMRIVFKLDKDVLLGCNLTTFSSSKRKNEEADCNETSTKKHRPQGEDEN